MLCDSCRVGLGPAVYVPQYSRRGAEIHQCLSCGLVQTAFMRSTDPTTRTKSISTDADWGNVRHGKGIRYVDARRYLSPILDTLRPSRVLDIGSSRGDFVKGMLTRDYVTAVVAVEPDTSLVHEYALLREERRLEVIWQRFEDAAVSGPFDFIYSCQTLEHATSAREMLTASHRLLAAHGRMYVEVPNIYVLADPRGVEEFFIDKHGFHFAPQTLRDLAARCGFIVLQDFSSDLYNIKVLLGKSDVADESRAGRDQAVEQMIAAYPKILERNRQLLMTLVETRLRPLGKRQKVAYWGANRLFDAIVRYGGLTPQDVYMLVDSHMVGKLEASAGIPIEHPDYIRSREPQVCVVLARSSESEVAALAYDMGVRHVLKYSELMDQVGTEVTSSV